MSQSDDPERLADASSRSELGELFASGSRDVPSNEQLARLAGELGPLLDAVPGPPPTSSGVSILVKLGIATAVVALLGGTVLTLRQASNRTPAPVSRAVTQRVTTPPTEAGPAPPASSPPPLAAAIPAASTGDDPSSRPLDKPSAAAAKSGSMPGKAQSEASLLEQARRVLNSSPSTALLLANQHAARFPNGVLTQEREVIAIEALRRLHRTSEADRRAAQFARAFPGSAHQRMVREPIPK